MNLQIKINIITVHYFTYILHHLIILCIYKYTVDYCHPFFVAMCNTFNNAVLTENRIVYLLVWVGNIIYKYMIVYYMD